jgi:hypothetical protein
MVKEEIFKWWRLWSALLLYVLEKRRLANW